MFSDCVYTAPGIEGYLCEECSDTIEDVEETGNALPAIVLCTHCGVALVPGWAAIPDDIQDDLFEWYNTVELDAEDKALLATLYHDGRFESLNCGHCEHRIRRGDPDDWGDFQGCHNDEGSGELCADCAVLCEELVQLRGY